MQINKPLAIYTSDPIKDIAHNRRIVYPVAQEVILQRGLEIKDKELRALYFFLYLTGARISEALKLKYGDINIKSVDKHRYAEVRLITLKNRQKGLRFILIPLYIPLEAQMYAYFAEIYDHRINTVFKDVGTRNNVWFKLKNITYDTEVLDLKTKQRAEQEVRLHPHLLRHFRLSHLVTLYSYNAFELQDFAGWSNLNMASIYVSMNTTAQANRFAAYPYMKQRIRINRGEAKS